MLRAAVDSAIASASEIWPASSMTRQSTDWRISSRHQSHAVPARRSYSPAAEKSAFDFEFPIIGSPSSDSLVNS